MTGETLSHTYPRMIKPGSAGEQGEVEKVERSLALQHLRSEIPGPCDAEMSSRCGV